MKKYLLVLIISAAIFNISVSPVFAQTTSADSLEVEYPIIPSGEVPPPETTGVGLPKYVEYIFYFLIWGSGILALLALIYGGFKYITAIGNPDKLRDAKDRIISALLGLAIVLGSYVILFQINPLFLQFELPQLQPFIKSISPGIWLCHSETSPDIQIVWALEQIYKTNSVDILIFQPEVLPEMLKILLIEGIDVRKITDTKNMAIRKQIRDKIDELLININKDCYKITGPGKIKDDFNDRNMRIWFVPEIEIIGKGVKLMAKYGAAIFDKDDFSGLGDIYMGHFYFINLLKDGNYLDTFLIKKENFDIRISSIKPFRYDYSYRYTKEPTKYFWTVDLYQGEGFNEDFMDPENPENPMPPFISWNQELFSPGDYYGHINPENIARMIPNPIVGELPIIYPKSIRIDGDVMVALYKDAVIEKNGILKAAPLIEKDGQLGRYFQVFFENESNLKNQWQINRWKACYREEEEICNPRTMEPGYIPMTTGDGTPCCAVEDADGVVILTNVKPLSL